MNNLEEVFAKLDVDTEDVSINKDDHYTSVKQLYDTHNGSSNVEITWRLARAAFKVSAAAEINGDKGRQKQFLLEAEDWARKAISLDKENADSHIWLATICGKLCDFLSAKERIVKGKECQEHLEAAIRLRPDDFITFYTYGRWCFEIASLSWMERKIATVIFGAPPESTYQDALDKFTIVKKLKPEWRANVIWMSKCLVALKEYSKAIEVAEEAASLAAKDEEDIAFDKDLEMIRKKYASYKVKA